MRILEGSKDLKILELDDSAGAKPALREAKLWICLAGAVAAQSAASRAAQAKVRMFFFSNKA